MDFVPRAGLRRACAPTLQTSVGFPRGKGKGNEVNRHHTPLTDEGVRVTVRRRPEAARRARIASVGVWGLRVGDITRPLTDDGLVPRQRPLAAPRSGRIGAHAGGRAGDDEVIGYQSKNRLPRRGRLRSQTLKGRRPRVSLSAPMLREYKRADLARSCQPLRSRFGALCSQASVSRSLRNWGSA